MKVRFLKTHVLHSAKPFKEGMEMNFNPKVAEILYAKGVVEILEEHNFETPKKTKVEKPKKEVIKPQVNNSKN
tara:strand:- start:34 stop:252 length:219 start_codon:yes stop_codon:yes gene_type:complete